MLKLHVLASGSRGNASVVENTETGHGILIDCGICKRDFFARCKEAGFDPALLDAVFITHDHGDHTKGLGVVLRGLAKLGVHPPVYAAPPIANASKAIQEATAFCGTLPFKAEDSITAAGASVIPFVTSHDAAASFGFRIEAGPDTLGFMTDTGIVTTQAHDALQSCRILAIEANHDPRMLKEGPYPWSIKQRIASEFGHLSNEQSAEELVRLLHASLEHVVAMHISENNNNYDLPRNALREALEREGHGAHVTCGYQGRLTSVS